MKSHSLKRAALTLLPLLYAACSGEARGPNELFTPGTDGSDTLGAAGSEPGAQSAAFVGGFPGAGTSGAGRPLSLGEGPETAIACGGTATTTRPQGSPRVETICLYSEGNAETPAATIEQIVEVVGGEEWVHVRLTLSPTFVDNSYGDAAIGWADRANAMRPPAAVPLDPAGAGVAPAPPAPGPGAPPPEKGKPGMDKPPGAADKPAKAAHTFDDLLGSDHAEIELTDANGQVILHFKQDYISKDASAPSGYASLGVTGGEGKMLVGDADWILAATTSLDRDLNGCGLGAYTASSPATDADYTPNTDAAAWDYRVVYEVWVDASAFGAAGFGTASIEFVHASPSKTANNTETVTPGPCPDDSGVGPTFDPPEIR